MKKHILLISITFIILLSLSGCRNAGYEAGKKRGIEDAESDAKTKYEPEITALETELYQITKNAKNKIATMNKNHAAQVDEMNNRHLSGINVLESSHAARIRDMEYTHNGELDNVKTSSYRIGQATMEERIGEMIDLDVNNKKLGTGWNDKVYSVREN
jgi:hypothetical protein